MDRSLFSQRGILIVPDKSDERKQTTRTATREPVQRRLSKDPERVFLDREKNVKGRILGKAYGWKKDAGVKRIPPVREEHSFTNPKRKCQKKQKKMGMCREDI